MENPRHTVLRTNLELAEIFLPHDPLCNPDGTPREQTPIEQWLRASCAATKKELEME